MNNLQLVKGEEVVFCPIDRKDRVPIYEANRGADGVIEHRQTTKSKGKVRVKSVLVKWRRWRKGVACFRIKGKRRAKSDRYTAIFEGKRSFTTTATVSLHKKETVRFEEEIKDLHLLSYCSDCPLRLSRLLKPCEMSKSKAIEKYGKVES